MMPNRHPVDVVRAVGSASIVYASSLHGVIVADALGIPAALLRLSGSKRSREPEFKYADYFESVGSSPRWIDVDEIASGSKASVDQIEAESEVRQRQAAALLPRLEASVRLLSGVV